MAAAAVPLIAAALPLLAPVIGAIVMGVEHLVQGKNQGPSKFDMVLQAVLQIVEKLGAAGTIPGQMDANSVAAMIQAVVTQLKAAGVLTPENAAAWLAALGKPGAAAAPSGPFVLSGTVQIVPAVQK